ncbi:MAG: dihydroorotase [Kiritimatiellae bacterium]|nr:dihydroorotase [Kiritimatiellia bacterium]
MNTAWIISNGTLLDPASGRRATADLYIEDGLIVADRPSNAREIDATGLTVMPGLIDVHVHFREPGHEGAETIATGSRAAARGGFTTVVTMPNTRPAVDTPEQVRFQLERAAEANAVELRPSACITSERRGSELADLEALAQAGAVAFTDDGSTVANDALMQRAMEQAAKLDIPIMDHALDPVRAGKGVLHDGDAARRLNLPGIPSKAEDMIVARDIELAAATGCAMHIQHVTSGASARLIGQAAARGLPVTGEATPHHLALSDADITEDDGNFKMNPPLRSPNDREILIESVLSGDLSILATDHAPHLASLKAKGILKAPFGVVGLETAIGVTYQLLVVERGMAPLDWLRRWTEGPAALLGRPCPSLAAGAPADIVIADLATEWAVDPSEFLSLSGNTPFAGRLCRGRAVHTLKSGGITWSGVDTFSGL